MTPWGLIEFESLTVDSVCIISQNKIEVLFFVFVVLGVRFAVIQSVRVGLTFLGIR